MQDNSKTTDLCECGAMSAIECGEIPGRHCGMWERKSDPAINPLAADSDALRVASALSTDLLERLDQDSGGMASPNPDDYTSFEHKLAKGMNERAYAEHEEDWAKDMWPVFLPHARAAIEALIDMGVCLS